MEDIKKVIGTRINTLLAKRDIKQKELAEVLEVQDNMISYFVSGKRQPNIEQLIKISDFFNVSIDYLTGKSEADTKDEDLTKICDFTGLSLKTVEKIVFWHSCDDRRKLWGKYLSSIIETEEADKLFSHISEFMGYQIVEAKAANMGKVDLAIEAIDMELARLWQISRRFTDIIENMGTETRLKGD